MKYRPIFNTKKVRLKRRNLEDVGISLEVFNTKKVRLKPLDEAAEIFNCELFNTKKVRLKPGDRGDGADLRRFSIPKRCD